MWAVRMFLGTLGRTLPLDASGIPGAGAETARGGGFEPPSSFEHWMFACPRRDGIAIQRLAGLGHPRVVAHNAPSGFKRLSVHPGRWQGPRARLPLPAAPTRRLDPALRGSRRGPNNEMLK